MIEENAWNSIEGKTPCKNCWLDQFKTHPVLDLVLECIKVDISGHKYIKKGM